MIAVGERIDEEIREVSVVDHYTYETIEFTLEADGELSEFWSLDSSYGWYDFRITTRSDPSFQHRLAGHLETRRDSMSDPAIGTVRPQEQASLSHNSPNKRAN